MNVEHLKPHSASYAQVSFKSAYLQIDGTEETKQIKAAQPEISVIGLSVINDKHVTAAMKAAGAEAVLLKDDLTQLHEAMRRCWSTHGLHESPRARQTRRRGLIPSI